MYKYQITLVHRDASDFQVAKKQLLVEVPEASELDEVSPIIVSKRVSDATVEAIKKYLDIRSIYEGDSLIIQNVERVHT